MSTPDPRDFARRLLARLGVRPPEAASVDPVALAAQVKAQTKKDAQTRVTGDSLNRDRLVILRLGLGRDSMTMLALLGEGQLVVEGKERGPHEVDAVVFTDPGGEWQFTYDLIPRVQKFCDNLGLTFIAQMKPPAEGPGGWIAWKRHQKKIADQLAAKGKTANAYSYGKPPWRANPHRSISERAASGYYHTRIPLFDDYDRKDAWILKGKAGASCTDTHKIVPNRELLQDLEMERFGTKGASRPHLMLLGLAADEKGRLEGGKKDSIERLEKGINEEEAYPLEEMKIKKSDEQRYLDALPGVDPSGRLRPGGFSDVKKSGCKFCKHQDKAQFWMLRELDPEFFKHVVALERRVVNKRGPAMAIFPRPLGTLIRGKPSALLQQQRHKPGREVSINPKDPSKSWVYTPLDVLVQEWEDAYVAKHGRRPDWEAVARKEYRGCAVAE